MSTTKNLRNCWRERNLNSALNANSGWRKTRYAMLVDIIHVEKINQGLRSYDVSMWL